MIRAAIFSSAILICAVRWGASPWTAPVRSHAPPEAQAALVARMIQIVYANGRDFPLCFGIAPAADPGHYLETMLPATKDLSDPSAELIRALKPHDPEVYPMSECSVVEGSSPERLAVRQSGRIGAVIWLRGVLWDGDSTAVGRAGFRAAGVGEFLCETRLRSKRWERAYCIRDW